MKNVLFFVSFLAFSWQGLAQTYTVQGTVNQNGNPLPGVSVSVKGMQSGTITNLEGYYQLSLEEGTYEVIFSHGNSKEVTLNLTQDETLNVDLSTAAEALNEVFLSSIRVDEKAPIAHSNLSKDEIAERNLGQDIPILMNYMPSVVTTSDAGAGVGYTGIRVRGTAGNRMNVTINGVPYNDAESQGTFWVNLGDFVSSVENIQLQRGVGTSTNGAGAFGASMNVLTDRYQKEALAEIANSYGSFNTHKHTAKFSTGLFNEHWEFAGKASLIESDGYIDRASSKLKSYFLQGTYVADNTIVKALTFGGNEKTYQAWYGIDKAIMLNDRTYNPSGYYVDAGGNERFYDDQTDNYAQDHYQLLWNQTYNENWSSDMALHYTYGRGYYEEYEDNTDITEFNLQPFTVDGEEISTSDLVTQEWLDNDFYGATFSANYENETVDAIFGGGWNRYEGDHYGYLVYTEFANNLNGPFDHYYDNTGTKTDFNVYAKSTFSITDKLALYGDVQLRTINYETEGIIDSGLDFNMKDDFTFFNPKAGITYQFNKANQVYFSYARANREPSRSEYKDAVEGAEDPTKVAYPKAEKLNDFELGWRHHSENVKLTVNTYYMAYKDQLVLTGELNDTGGFVRTNSGESYRLGIEIDAQIKLNDKFSIQPNVTFSQNKNKDYTERFNGVTQNFGDTDISFSPNIIAGNMLRFSPVKNLQLNYLTKVVSDQYMSNTEAKNSKLKGYVTNSFNIQYNWKTAPLFKEIIFTGLINNIFDVKYASNGYYYTYDIENENNPSGVETIGGTGYYPQAGINFLTGITLKF